jgi:hypothetical protein
MKEKLNYTVDSPFFSCRLDQYQSDAIKLTDFMKTMIRQMRQVCKDMKQCSKSMEIFSLFVQNGLKTLSENSPILLLLKQFSEIFTDYASSQDILSTSLERTFTEPLEIFCLREVASTISTIQLYSTLKDTGENTILKYLQSDQANFGRGLAPHQLEQRAYDVVQQKRKYETVRYDLVQKINEVEAQKSYEFTESCLSGTFALRTHFHLCLEKISSLQKQFSEFQTQQQRDHQLYVEEMKPFVRKRRDLTNVLDAMVERVELASPHLTGAVGDGTGGGGGGGGASPVANEKGSMSHLVEENPSGATTTTPAGSTSWQSMTRMGVSWGANIIGNLTRQSQQILQPDSSSHAPSSTHEREKPRRHSPAPGGGGGGGSNQEDSTSTPSAPFGATCEECEARMKALDSSELVPLFQPAPFGELGTPGIIKQVLSLSICRSSSLLGIPLETK